MLFAIDETLAQKARIGELVLPDQGNAESVNTLRTTGESQKPQELDAWVKGTPKSRITPAFARFSDSLTVVAGIDFGSVAQIVDLFQRWP